MSIFNGVKLHKVEQKSDGSFAALFIVPLVVRLDISNDTANAVEQENAETLNALLDTAKESLALSLYGQSATELINLRNALPKKYQAKVNRVLSNLIKGELNNETAG